MVSAARWGVTPPYPLGMLARRIEFVGEKDSGHNQASLPLVMCLAQSVLAGSLAVAATGLLFASDALMLDTMTIGAVVGAGLGLMMGLPQAWLTRWRAARFVWLLFGIAGGLWTARGVGAFSRLHGEHATMAWGSIVVGVVGGTALGACCIAVQPGRDGVSPLGRTRLAIRASAGLLGLLVAVVAGLYEITTDWLRGYPAARQALVGTGWTLVFCVFHGLLGVLWQRPRLARICGLNWVLLVGAGFVMTARHGDARFSELMVDGQMEHTLGLLRTATDWDRDGASGWFGGGDCAPTNPRIFPCAREIPGNGIDDNCRGGDARPAILPQLKTGATPSGPSPVNVLLVTLDAVRADHTTPYGYSRDTTPNLQRLAESGTVYQRAYPPGGWTCLTIPSIFAGIASRKLPYVPKAYTTRGRLVDLPWQKYVEKGEWQENDMTVAQLQGRFTLPAALRSRGMRTAAVTGGGVMPMIVRYLGDGWESREHSADTEDDRSVSELAIRRMRMLSEVPFLLWVHLFDAHGGQTVHPGIRGFGDTVIDKYDHEVASVDHELGKILTALDEITARPTAVFVAADHGEAFDRGAQFHGDDLFEDVMRVPLIVKIPGQSPNHVGGVVSLLDLAPTILAVTETPIPAGLEGRELGREDPNRTILTDLWRMNHRGQAYLDQIAIVNRDYRYIFDRPKQSGILTATSDLSRPPRALSEPQVSAAFIQLLNAYLDEELLAP